MNPDISVEKFSLIPAQAGIQMIKYFPRTRDDIKVWSALQGNVLGWIPACAGMTA